MILSIFNCTLRNFPIGIAGSANKRKAYCGEALLSLQGVLAAMVNLTCCRCVWSLHAHINRPEESGCCDGYK